jgi:hypothetical protein
VGGSDVGMRVCLAIERDFMKPRLTLMAGITATLMFSVFAEVAPLRLDGDVEVKTKTQSGKADPKSPNREVNMSKQLALKVRNTSGEQQKATVRYWLFGRDAKNVLEVVGGGEVEVSVPAKGSERVEMDPVDFEFKEPKSIQPMRMAGRPAQRTAQPTQKAEKKGTKYAGFGVQVLRGSEVMASQFSEETYMAKVGAGRTKAGEKFEATEAKK